MPLQFYFGASGAGKSHRLYEDIIERSIKEPDTNFIVIVPEQFTMQTQKELVLRHPRGGIMNIDILSFARLAYRIFEETGRTGKEVLDDMSKNLVLRRIASRHQEELSVLGRNLKKLGYISEVKSVISEFMQYGIKTEDMDAMIDAVKKRPLLQYKLKDMRLLYEIFRQEIAEKYMTTEELLEVAAGAACESKLLKKSVIAFDGFTGFTPVQIRLLQQLMALTRGVIVTVLMDSRRSPFVDDGEQALFHLSQKTVLALEEKAREAGVSRERDVCLPDTPVRRYREKPALAHLERSLFRYGRQKPGADARGISIWSAANPMEELHEICLRIGRLVREQGLRYGEIAVITGDMPAYTYFAEASFEKYGIPVFMDRTRGILLNPCVEFIRAALEILMKNYSYESVFRYLRTGLAGFTTQETDRLENYVLALGIRGRSAWHKRWTRCYKELSEEGLAQLEELRERLAAQLAPLHEKAEDALALSKLLYEFMMSARLQQKLKGYESYFSARGEAARAREYAQIYKIVIDLLDKIAGLLGAEKMSLQEFSEILDAGFAEARVGMIPPSPDRVVFGDMERTRLGGIKVLFFAGVNDGIIPKSGGSGGILSDMDRQALKEGQVELAPTARELAYRQRLYLYMNLTKPSQGLQLSYARVGGEGRSMRPSYLIAELCGLYEGLTVEEVIREEGHIMSKEDGLDWLAAHIHEPPTPMYTGLANWLAGSEEGKRWLQDLADTAFYTYRPDTISRAVTRALYGKVFNNSVTRLERYAACAYAHFLEYGLRLKERRMYLFEQRDMGNVFHQVLEHYGRLLAESGYTWFDVPGDAAEQMLDTAIEAVVTGYGETVLYSTARNQYGITRMRRILRRTVEALSSQVKKGSFVPERYEVSFQSIADYEAIHVQLTEEESMHLKGRIDRLDSYEDDENVYVKVIDYKSGVKKFDLAAVYYGLQLQLVLYMNVAVEAERRQHPDKTVVPAGILYYHIDDPLVEREEGAPGDIDERILESLKMNGLVNDDPDIVRLFDKEMEKKSTVIPVSLNKDGSFSRASSVASTDQMEWISEFVTNKVSELGREIVEGHVEVNPYADGAVTACDYCRFAGICGFDSGITGFHHHQLKKYSREEAMTLMSQTHDTCG